MTSKTLLAFIFFVSSVVQAELPFSNTLPVESVDAATVTTRHHGRVGLEPVVCTTEQVSVGEQIDRVASVVDISPLIDQIAIEVDEIGPDGVQRREQVVTGRIALLPFDQTDGLVRIFITSKSVRCSGNEA